MENNRYIEIDAYNIGIGKPTYVPFWDSHLNFKLEEGEDEYPYVEVTAGYHKLQPVKLLWDLIEKTFIQPIEFEVKRQPHLSKYEIGEKLLYESGRRQFRISKLVEITYKNGDHSIKRGENLTISERELVGNKFKGNQLYKINFMVPVFGFEDGAKIHYEHQIYKLAPDNEKSS